MKEPPQVSPNKRDNSFNNLFELQIYKIILERTSKFQIKEGKI